MKPTVYIETTIVSYLTARPSRDVLKLAKQLTTRDWWNTHRPSFDLFTSELVAIEASAGDAGAAQERLKVLSSIPLVNATPASDALGKALIRAAAIPRNASRDAIHVSIAATNGIEYLLTWNCAHLANAAMRHKIDEACQRAGFRSPIITTPDTLFLKATDE